MFAESAVPLASFQDAFAHALTAEPAQVDPIVARIAAQPAFDVYRNTLMKGAIDALEANFPTVSQLVGTEWFRAAAREHACVTPPGEPSLLRYGSAFPAFLAEFAPAAELPYLSDVARLDRLWTEAHIAEDQPTLGGTTIAALDPEALGEAILVPHPAARWAWFPDAPVYTIWRSNREGSDDQRDLAWQGEGALLTRPEDAVRWSALDAAGCRLLDACTQGMPLARALDSALETDPNANLVQLLRALLDAGAFGRLNPAPDDGHEGVSP